ncbi:hypothetical protein K438DRAFT_1836367 [Mycena galopus ATCC 62051]|nr:hypothetical protein K438DRAFT_1868276 [Mycena galopus ATCC 62051]KAF8185818.1 hypothetical protein K438DRAFT_1836367 [Mycena galopus ATCC 62051]
MCKITHRDAIHKLGKATCPKCGALRGYGTSGVMNLVATHLDKDGCRTEAAKKDKKGRNSLLTSFFRDKAPIKSFLKPTLTVPIANVDNPLSEFAGQPTEYASQSIPPAELWEELAPHFHRAFGYGMDLAQRRRMVQRGPSGLDAVIRFLDYFICERGLEGGMLELKMEQLIEAVKSVYVVACSAFILVLNVT